MRKAKSTIVSEYQRKANLAKRIEDIFHEPDGIQIAQEVMAAFIGHAKTAKTAAKSSVAPAPQKHSRASRTTRGGLQDLVLAAFDNVPAPCSTFELADAMKANGFQFVGPRPDKVVNSVINTLAKRGKVQFVRKNGKLRLWRKVGHVSPDQGFIEGVRTQ